MSVSLVITAAGKSSRFGSDKLSFSLGTKTVGELSLDAYSGISFLSRTIVIGESRANLASYAIKSGFKVCVNNNPEYGLSYSVKLGLNDILSDSNPDGILFAAADMPFLKPNTVKQLLAGFESKPDSITVLTHEGKLCKPVIFPSSLFDELKQISGDIGGKSVIIRHPEMVHTVSATSRELSDIDTLHDVTNFV